MNKDNACAAWAARPAAVTSLALIAIVAIALITYSNAFKAPLLFDDGGYIIENTAITGFSYLWDTSLTEGLPLHKNVTSSLSTRYLVYVTFALNYHFHRLSPMGYHAVNILVHIINALLLYLLIRLSFKTPFLKGSKAAPYSSHIALFSALVFLTHPIQTEAVTFVSQRFTSMCAMFYLASLASYISSRLSDSKTRRYVLYGLSIIFAIAAMKSKEIAFTLPIAIGLYEFSFFSGERKRRILLLIPILLTMLIVPLSLMDFSKPLSEALEGATRTEQSVSRADYLLTQFTVVVTYIRLMFLPINQNLDYDYPLYTSLFEPKVLMSFIFLMALMGAAIYLYIRSRRGKPALRLIGFGVFWFFIALSVESSLMPLEDLIFEHRAYLPSVFFVASVVTAIYIIGLKAGARRAVAVMLAVAVLALSVAAYARNRVWGSELALWLDAVSKSPMKSRTHYNLGAAYEALADYDRAMEEFQTATRLKPPLKEAHFNLGFYYLQRGRMMEAAREFEAALRIDPRYGKALRFLRYTQRQLAQGVE